MKEKNTTITVSYRPSKEAEIFLSENAGGGGILSRSQLVEIAVRFLMGLSETRLEKLIGMSKSLDSLDKYAKAIGEIVDLSDPAVEVAQPLHIFGELGEAPIDDAAAVTTQFGLSLVAADFIEGFHLFHIFGDTEPSAIFIDVFGIGIDQWRRLQAWRTGFGVEEETQ